MAYFYYFEDSKSYKISHPLQKKITENRPPPLLREFKKKRKHLDVCVKLCPITRSWCYEREKSF